MKKKVFLAVALFALATVGAFAQYNAESDFKVKKVGNGITITKYTGKATEVNIPPTIQNLPVTSIGQKAFSLSKVTSITIPDSVTSIAFWALASRNITSVTFQGTISSANFIPSYTHIGDLRDKYLVDGIGTYTRSSGSEQWTNADAAANRAAAVATLAAAAAAPANASQVDAKLNGKWRASARVGEYEDDLVEFSFLAGNYEILKETGADQLNRSIIEPAVKGTYATDTKGNIFLKPTHVYQRYQKTWITIDELKNAWKSQGMSDALLKEELEEAWAMDMPLVYSITLESVLQLNKGRETYTYFRQ